ncbi:MAG: hypothetical protein QX203_08880 [Methylococcaceae bacterium]
MDGLTMLIGSHFNLKRGDRVKPKNAYGSSVFRHQPAAAQEFFAADAGFCHWL